MVTFLWEFYNGESSLVCTNSESVNVKGLHCDVPCISNLVYKLGLWKNQLKWKHSTFPLNNRKKITISCVNNLPSIFCSPSFPPLCCVSSRAPRYSYPVFTFNCFYLILVLNIYIYTYMYSNKISPCRHRIVWNLHSVS